jgi:UDP-galactopyranose mutase
VKGRKTTASNSGFDESIELEGMDIVCLAHLRWDFVFQRPQHLMTRFVRERRVYYVEEPRFDDGPVRIVMNQDVSGVHIVIPYLTHAMSKEEGAKAHRELMEELISGQKIDRYILWYYTPMALSFTRQLQPAMVVYDCMDELSAFNGAPTKIKEYENELVKRADLIFTGGQSLFEAKRDSHHNIHPFPSSIDVDHFAKARSVPSEPQDQAGIPHPRLGFYGVIDERMDLELIEEIARSCPEWQLVMIGPLAKVEESDLPHLPNIHYLGSKPYNELPDYLGGWDVALLPFARNKSTRFISPTKTPEYLAGGIPVVSTPIKDVVRPYGEKGLVSIAENPKEFVEAVKEILDPDHDRQAWLQKVDLFLANISWEDTWQGMKSQITKTASIAMEQEKNNGRRSVKTPQPSSHSKFSYEDRANPRQANGGNKTNGAKGFDFLIVGAGFAGSVLAERLARGSGLKVLLVECRPHIGGNAYDYYDQNGLLIHKYGPHIFHTNSHEVFTYLSRFTPWRSYEHRVLASVDGQLLPIPINLDTVNRLYGLNLTSMDLEGFFQSMAEPIENIQTSEDVVISKIGRELYEKFFRNYTRKQWDLDPSELDSTVTSRVPIRLNRDDRYFSDVYQSMPLYGYTNMFQNMLDHPNIKIMLNTDYRDIVDFIPFRQMIYTGPVDEYFGYRFGKLPYRSLQFKFETLEVARHQPVAVVNYPNEHAFTRVTEFKHLTGQNHPKTSLVYEFPCAEGDPYYPIPRPENASLYKKYKKLAEAEPGVYFAGRLATYKYYNMDQVTAQALTLYARIMDIPRPKATAAISNNPFQIDIPCSLLNMPVSEEVEVKKAQ